ncbi:MBL fold metallo-hydrolase [Thermoflavimicrobium dichotomicum]|uniref:Phosphoribosyl 1,2-cyclic phosphodiesterase n=1 Tax=Thermoflavimicrobium dichotomicum TaxID=46223 RepID=A0A1I3KA18_9BACL|nr:MBL fold metallo-hydrolase [Thermoflavimicrobium dichotomicum]SFI69346.1 Phosphoribosyl 1,2-cyclic phosphodiesterase [Thermoflavimicrobium dichotomicum]
MRFSVLASGSSGNSIYIESERARVLIDAGLSGKQLEERLKQIGVHPSTLSAILVTHEHIDHVKGLGVLARRYQIPVYMNEATQKHLPTSVGTIPEKQQHLFHSQAIIEVEDLQIESFPVSHDAAEPVGYALHVDNETIAVVTDLGYVSQRIIEKVSGADTLIWESNHDVEMLRVGSYPWNVKRRILSDIGHLSNEDSGEALVDVLHGKGEHVYLAHLSKDNNLSELAHLTVKEILEDAGLEVGKDVHLWETYADRPTPLRYVKTRK